MSALAERYIRWASKHDPLTALSLAVFLPMALFTAGLVGLLYLAVNA